MKLQASKDSQGLQRCSKVNYVGWLVSGRGTDFAKFRPVFVYL